MLTPRVRRVSSRTRSLNRSTAFGAIRRFGAPFARETEAQKLPLPWPRHRALLLVHLELELRRDESRDALHHSLPRPPAANVDVASRPRYRAKRCPRRSNSRSNSSSTMLLSKGERGPPCGVPSSTGLTSPPSITPAVRNARISFSNRLSLTRSAILAISLSCETRSKNFSRSKSTHQR